MIRFQCEQGKRVCSFAERLIRQASLCLVDTSIGRVSYVLENIGTIRNYDYNSTDM